MKADPHNILPLPIAALRRRARNAQSAKERHDTGYFALEASIRLNVAANLPHHVARLAMPSVGQWSEATTVSDSPLSDPRVVAMYAFLSEVAVGKQVTARAVSARRLLLLLPAYRNLLIGHGATRSLEFYEKANTLLLDGLDACWELNVFLPCSASVVYVDSVEVGANGTRKARVLSVMGLATFILEPAGSAVPDLVLPRRLYVANDGTYRTLHPMLLFHEQDLRERVLFFNGMRRTPKYLDYVSGEELKGNPLQAAFPDIDKNCSDLFAESPADEPAIERADASRFGGYKLLGKLGEGGMGIVYLALQESLQRVVALKMLPASSVDDAVAVARFKREIAALSLCDHPNVVKILASGEQSGALYYTMELVAGADLAMIARSLPAAKSLNEAVSSAAGALKEARKDIYEHLPVLRYRASTTAAGQERIRALVELFRDAAEAVAYLHDQGIIHRDLKPSNLMVTTAEHRLVVMDLGLALLSDASKTLTRDGRSILGTLRYMPPEQLQRNLAQVDRRADVYSLAATFYELLTARPFFDGETEARTIQQVLHEEPVAPRKANSAIPSDLATILRKATRKNPRERYESAAALAADLHAFLQGRPISARAPALWYILSLSVRRHKYAVAGIILGLVLLVAAALTTFQRERSLRLYAQSMLERADAEKNRGDVLFASMLEEQGRSALLAGAHAKAALYLSEAYSRAPQRASLRFLLAESLRHADLLQTVLEGHRGSVNSVAFSAAGGRIVTAGHDGTARVWDTYSGELMLTLDGSMGPLASAQFSDGGDVVIARRSSGGDAVWDIGSSVPARAPLEVDEQVRVVGDRYVLTGTRGGKLRVWSMGEHATAKALDASSATWKWFALSERHDRVVAIDTAGRAIVWELASGNLLKQIETREDRIVAVAFDDSDNVVWVTLADLSMVAFDVQSGRRGVVRRADSNGQVASGVDYTIETDHGLNPRLLNPSREVVAVLDGHRDRVTAHAFSADRQLFATSSADGTVIVWRKDLPSRFVASVRGGAYAALSPCGRYIATPAIISMDSLIPGEDHCSDGSHTRGGFVPISFSSDGSRVSYPCGESGAAVVADTVLDKKLISIKGHQEPLFVATLSGNGQLLVTGSEDKTARIWSVADGTGGLVLGPHPEAVTEAEFSPDGDLVLTVAGRTAWLWHSDSGNQFGKLKGHRLPIHDAAFSPAGCLVATAGGDKTARLFDCTSPDALGSPKVLEGHLDSVVKVVFDRSGAKLLTCGYDGSAKLFDVATGQLLTALDGHSGRVLTGAFSHDGLVATGGADGKAILWSLDGRRLATIDARGWTTSVGFSADGSRLMAAEVGGVTLWDVHLESRPPSEVAEVVSRRVPLTLLSDGRLVPNPRRQQ